jgi:hypothetical protein
MFNKMGQSFSVVREKPQKKPHVFFREVRDVVDIKDNKDVAVKEAVQPATPSGPTLDIDALDNESRILDAIVFDSETKFSAVFEATVADDTTKADVKGFKSIKAPKIADVPYASEAYSEEPYTLANPGSPRHTIYVDEKDLKKKKNSRGGF